MKRMILKIKYVAVIVCLLFISSVFSNATIAFNVSLHNEVCDDFDSKIEELMEYGHYPGLSACIVKDNTTVWSKGYGYSNLRRFHKIKATSETVYPIASISKSFTATVIMQLNESGLIGLDDNVSQYLPFDLKNPRYPNVNITPRMLLAHQSSMKSLGFLLTSLLTSITYAIQINPINWFERHFKKSRAWFDYAPGENVFYASVDINILGVVIENITKQSFSDYCQEHIFTPLEMKNTSFYLSDFDRDQLSRHYVWFGIKYFRLPFFPAPEFMFPGGGIRSTITDMSHYLIMHTSGGLYNGTRILSEESVEEMHRAQYPDSPEGGKVFHGLGWYSHKEYGDWEICGGHSGDPPGSYARMRMRYSDKVGIIYFWNQDTIIYMNEKPSKWMEALKEIGYLLFQKAEEL